ncbi:MAG: phosphate/phosphite/phosphonate ABC transporter substrate-binding protein [Desulfobacterales bacterium]|nr:MAG: phosphate/phosphite/phosphonate ABC transporter substrate-binding protein [Desulfobacterales bacterium]
MTTHVKFLIGSLLFAMLVVVSGCGKDSDAVVVDFSKTLKVERPAGQVSESGTLKVAVAAMISPKETLIFYEQLLNYIGVRLGQDIQLVQRKTYEEVNTLIDKEQIDLAFICSGPYANDKQKYGLEALATPLVRNEPFYHSYLIVNIESPYQNLNDLRGHTFAFTDPDSNSGALVPKFWLRQLGESPDSFFGKTIYTYSHDNSILAVARSLVDGAAVDGHKWEYYSKQNPLYTSKTRVIKKSEPFGSPPLVASSMIPEILKRQIRETLYTMHLDPAGKKILSELLIDRFVPPQEQWYAPIRMMQQSLEQIETTSHADAQS